MARWLLKSAHYLNLDPPAEWEYKETDQLTGQTARTVCKVPTYLDPKQKAFVVCYKGKGQPGDLTFLGEPTAEMDPIDDEAIAISKSLEHKWIHPIDSLPGTTFSDSLLDQLNKSIAALVVNKGQQPAVTQAVDPAEFAALQAQVKELLEQNTALKKTQPIARRA